jgi:hypothetical protein
MTNSFRPKGARLAAANRSAVLLHAGYPNKGLLLYKYNIIPWPNAVTKLQCDTCSAQRDPVPDPAGFINPESCPEEGI